MPGKQFKVRPVLFGRRFSREKKRGIPIQEGKPDPPPSVRSCTMFRFWQLDVFALMGIRRPKTSHKRARRHRLWLERLEDRTVPTTLNVTVPTDNGNGKVANTLSWAIKKAQQNDTI